MLFASNHIAARVAFDAGAGLVLAIVLRSAVAAIIMSSIAMVKKQSFRVLPVKRPWLAAIGFLIAFQSWCLYSSVAIMPVAISLLLVNAWPVIYIAVSWALGGTRPSLPLILALGVIVSGLALVMNVSSASASLDLSTSQWWLGVFYGLAAAVLLATAMWITNNKLNTMAGSVRSAYSMMIVSSSLLVIGLMGWLPSNFSLPSSIWGYVGLVCLALFYGVASTILFVLAPRLDMSRNSPILNFEPVASVILGYVLLGQVLTPIQLVGGAMVVGGIVIVGLLRS